MKRKFNNVVLGQKTRTLANKTKMFYFEDDKSRPCIQVTFEDGKYDFDNINNVIDLNKNIKKKIIYTRCVVDQYHDVQMAIEKMQENTMNIDSSIFKKDFAKVFKEFTEDLRMAYILLTVI